jgi:hypothetical protein
MRTTPSATDTARQRPTRKSRPEPTPQPGDSAAAEASPSRLELIRMTAFALYEARGCEDGHELDDWLRAEAEVDAKSAPPVAH